ncbi:MAG: MTH938/NDUFAF3 family protein [Desulfopila sp.]|jgi:hypothetical protein|nr:MTH938/NDUFAF3 family protein [Desulfopila sp.]
MSADLKKTSPKILSVKWGKMEVDTLGKGKDFKLWPGGGRSWDWSEHGTGHSQGIQPGDCEELVRNGCLIVVLSRGVFRRLKIAEETLEYLKSNSVDVVVEDTKKAVQTYNAYASEGRLVGGLFHTTC